MIRRRWKKRSGVFFQKFYKGLSDSAIINEDRANAMLRRDGIICRWWDKADRISPAQIQDKLTARNLYWHLNRYSDEDPTEGNERFFEHTPFISATAGTIERDSLRSRNYLHDPLITALRFATNNLRDDGFIFCGYVYTLGKRGVQLQPFAEEVRELNIYLDYLPFQPEGEITAKIIIPAVNLEKYERYEANVVRQQVRRGERIRPSATEYNMGYAPPFRFANVREVLR